MEKPKKSASANFLKPLKRLSKRFHLTLFFIFITAALAGAVLVINDTLNESSTDSDYTSTINAGSIDEATLTRLNTLHTSTENTPAPALPAGRTNPVNE